MIGRLVSYKGFDRLAAALALLPKDAPIRIRIVGDGPAHDLVSRLFDGDPRVETDLRWTDEASRRILLAAHDAVLCPYGEATQSGIICEALAAARITVVTPAGALPEQVGTGAAGRILKDLTPQSLAKGLMAPLPPAALVNKACHWQLEQAHAGLSWQALFEAW